MVRRSFTCAVSLVVACAALLGTDPGAAQSSGDSLAAALGPRCGTLDREARELLFGFPFDPSDCSATSTTNECKPLSTRIRAS